MESELNRGTIRKIYLRQVEAANKMSETTDFETHQPVGTETILLVEDEKMIRDLALEVLQMSGYTVLEASGPDAALEICRQYQRTIHLMMTDVVMPTMNGRELAEQVAKFRPEVKILYMSGYPDDAVVRHGILNSNVAFLQKPFSLDALARKVREVLDRRGK